MTALRSAAVKALCIALYAAAARSAELDVPSLSGDQVPSGAIWLDSLDLGNVETGYLSARAGHSIESRGMRVHGVAYRHGVGTHAVSRMQVDLKGAAERFVVMPGIDDETAGKGSVTFEVWVDGKKAADSGLVRGNDEPKQLSVDLRGAKKMELIVTDGGNGTVFDHADWAGAVLMLAPGAKELPVSIAAPTVPPPEIAHGESPLPAIHGPRIAGSTPGRPFLFLIPATGDAPLTFSAKNLPAGLTLDSATGIIAGALNHSGTTAIELTVTNSRGAAHRTLTIVGGQGRLALTPPMGWNSWNCWANAVSDVKIRAAADAMVKSRLAAHGFQYVNIDDCWEAKRDHQGEIRANSKFPDMKALADYVHSKGLKLGIYSTPGPKTCAGFEGSWKHEQQDVDTYAKWGIDYLKYDWCSYGQVASGTNRAALMKPYEVMHAALDKCDRDIVFSLCQYGKGNVWEWGADVGGNCWRTTGDIDDHWENMASIGFAQNGHERFAGPGHWNDPDMLVIGRVGWGPTLHPSRLKPDEQLTHVSLWCLLAAPLLVGCDMSQIDDFALAQLTNDEVLDIDQDPLGKPAGRIFRNGEMEAWARPLADGTQAVGLFNRGPSAGSIAIAWSDLKLAGPQPVRDLWLRKDRGQFTDRYEAKVRPHGVVLIKVGKSSE